MIDNNQILRIWLIVSQSNNSKLSKYLRHQFSKFEVENDVKIQIEFVTWERVLPALFKDFKNGKAPDVLQIGSSWVSTFAHMGYLDKVPENFDIKPSINEGINSLCQYNDEYYTVPWIIDTVIMAGRRDYMDEMKVRKENVKDYRKLKQFTKEIMERKKKNSDLPKPISFAIKRENDTLQRFFSVLWSRGWEFPDFNTVPDKIVYDPMVIETIKYFAEVKIICDNAEEIERHPYQVNDDFYAHGKSIFYMGSWYGIVDKINNEGEKSHKYCVIPFPGSGNKACSYGGGTMLAVSSRSKHKAKSWKLVEFLLEDKFIRKFDIGNVPAFDGDFWKKRFEDKRIKLLYEQTKRSRIYPPNPAWINIEDKIIKGIGSILLRLIRKRKIEFEEKDYLLLKETDQKIQKILNMCWEMR